MPNGTAIPAVTAARFGDPFVVDCFTTFLVQFPSGTKFRDGDVGVEEVVVIIDREEEVEDVVVNGEREEKVEEVDMKMISPSGMLIRSLIVQL